MRVLIYSEKPDAQSLLEILRDAGDKASLRNPEMFRASELETADAVYISSADKFGKVIFDAYHAKEISVMWIENVGLSDEVESVTVENKPRRGRKAK